MEDIGVQPVTPEDNSLRKDLDVIKVVVRLRNSSDHDCQIVRVSGACSCFVEARFPERIKSKEISEVAVYFDRSKLGTAPRYSADLVFGGKLSQGKEVAQRIRIEIPLSTEAAVLLPPSKEISAMELQASGYKVLYPLLVSPSAKFVVKRVEAYAGHKEILRGASWVQRNGLVYEGKWLHSADVVVEIDSETLKDLVGKESIVLRCFLEIEGNQRCLEATLYVI